MAHFTQAVVAYTVNLSPNTNQTQMHNMMIGARLDTSLAMLASVTKTADVVTNPSGTTVTRTVTYSLNTPPLVLTGANNQTVNYAAGTIESSSPKDTLTGVGMQQINIAWTDAAGGAHNQTVNMNGQTPVVFGNNNVAIITGFTAIAVGSWGANVGQLALRMPTPGVMLPVVGGPAGGGAGPAIMGPGGPGTLPGSGVGVTIDFRQGGRPTARQGPYVPAGLPGAQRGAVVAVIPDSFYTRFPDTNNAAQVRYFQNWFMEGMMGYTGPTIQAVPVLS